MGECILFNNILETLCYEHLICEICFDFLERDCKANKTFDLNLASECLFKILPDIIRDSSFSKGRSEGDGENNSWLQR